MKITTFFLTIAIMTASAATHAQKVTLSEKNTPLQKVINEIRKQTGYDFIYDSKLIKNAKPVTINVTNVNIDEALNECFSNQELSYELEDKTIFIKEKAVSLIDKAKALFGQSTISGKVTDEIGRALAGVTIKVKDSNIATATDSKGFYTLAVPNENSTITFSFVGFETLQISAKDVPSGSVISLKATMTNLKEVIVNKGYYNERNELSIGQVAHISANEISEQPVNNPLLAMAGQMAGVSVVESSGVPGAGVKVQIRGTNTISQAKDPLYVIDGVPYIATLFINNQNYQQGLGSSIIGGANPFSFLNPSDISSIDVLKDAEATSLYGSRGANGVILITTKKGAPGNLKANVNFQSGAGKITRKANLMNTDQYLQMRNQGFRNDGVLPSSTDLDVNGTWSKTSTTDWQDVMIGGTSQYTDAQASVSGGSVNTQYLLGTGYHKETTVFPGSWNDQKVSLHFNINSCSDNRKFKMSFSGSFISDNNKLPNGDYTQYILLAPNAPSLYKPDGSLNWTDFFSNPFAINLQTYTAKTNNLISSGLLSYSILPGLELKSTFGYNNIQLEENTGLPIEYYNPLAKATTGNAVFNHNINNSWIIEPQITYKTRIGNGDLNAIIGATFQSRQSNGQIINGAGYTNNALLGSLSAAATISNGATIFEKYKYTSAFGRLGYDFDDKYLLSASFRRDGSSRFGPGKEFGNFGSIGAGWIFTNESFLKNTVSFLNFGKIKASYGTTGNEPSDNYKYLELYNFSTGFNTYQGGTSLSPNNLPNSDYAWEIIKKLDIGIELGFLKDRILFSGNYYRTRSDNQLVSYPLASTTGFSSITYNLPAVVQNTGLEFTLNTINVKEKDFTWTSAVNLSINRNKLVSFPGIVNTSYNSVYTIGLPLSAIKVFHYAGVDPATGVYQFYDKNGNLTFTPTDPDDKVGGLINIDPEFYGGVQNSFKYKRFQIDLLFQFVKQTGKNYLFAGNLTPGRYSFFGTTGNQPAELSNNQWQNPGDLTLYQKFSQATTTVNNAFTNYAKSSNIAYSDASFIRLKNLSFSYLLPALWAKKLHLDNVRLYIQAQNLLTFTNYLGVDPENQSLTALPPLRIVTTGIQVNL